jgi:hypothetical protein
MKVFSENWQRDGLVLMASRAVRAFALSLLSIVLAIYLAQLGFSTVTVGLVFSTGYASAAGITTLSHHAPIAVSPTISAYLMHSFSLNMPIFLGGLLQLINDFSFYFLFRDVKPPEEQTAKPQPVTALT